MNDCQENPEGIKQKNDVNPYITAHETLRVEEKAERSHQTQKKKSNGIIAGFWRRVAAFAVDGIIITLTLFLVGYLFKDIAFALGPYGRFVGYGLFILYMGYFNSEKRNGQTIGKQLFNIVVLDQTGNHLSLGKSFLRTFSFSLIFMLNQWQLPILQNRIIAFITGIIFFGGILGLFYGFIFNRTTRQGIHDLIAGSIVVKAPPKFDVLPKTPLIHRRITIGLVGVGLAIGLAGLNQQPHRDLGSGIIEEEEWQALSELQTILRKNNEYFVVGVNQLSRLNIQDPATLKEMNFDLLAKTSCVGNSDNCPQLTIETNQTGTDQLDSVEDLTDKQTAVIKELTIELWAKTSCANKSDYCQDLIMETAQIAIDQFDDIENLSGMQIFINNRFDLGFASGHFSQGSSRSIEDWQTDLRE